MSFLDYEFLKNRIHKTASEGQKQGEVPSDKAYKEDASYKENGEGKFPIRENSSFESKDISDARRLMHHVSPEDQKKVKERICHIYKSKPDKYQKEYDEFCK